MRTTVSGYRLLQLLHRRHGRDVWLGQASEGSRPIVIKRAASVDGRYANRPLAWEADVLAALDHPNVIELIATLDDPPDQVLVLSWVPGCSLRDLLDDRGTLAPGELVALLHGVAAAVDHLDDHGFVHGDLRPDHVLLTEDGNPVLVGFGSAVTISGTPAREPATVTSIDGAVRFGAVDDPTYLHPMIAANGRPDGRSEVFSLGVIAYECLTGRVPHRGTPAEVVALAAATVHRPLSSWPSVPPGVAEAVEAALTPDSPDAPVDAVAFVALLRAAIDPSTVVLPRPSIDLHRALAVPATGETLPFGPRPAVALAPVTSEAWRVAVAAAIAASVVAALWFLAGAAMGI